MPKTGMPGLLLASCAAAQHSRAINARAYGNGFFELRVPAAYAVPEGLRLTGTACRLDHTTLLSPEFVRIEQASEAGEIVHVARAPLDPIYVKVDQRCSHYSLTVAWKPQPTDTINICFDRGATCSATAHAVR